MASRCPKADRNSINPEPVSEIADWTMAWSRSFDIRSANTVLHWDKIVGSISAGRWVTMHSDAPYLRPSFAILAMARLQGHQRLDADVARQRAEAVRLAQEEMETLRSFGTSTTAAGMRSFDSIASASRSVDAGTAYLIDRQIAPIDLAQAKSASVSVRWTDRSGTAQQVALHSIISGTDPALSGALALAAR